MNFVNIHEDAWKDLCEKSRELKTWDHFQTLCEDEYGDPSELVGEEIRVKTMKLANAILDIENGTNREEDGE